jgi:hypothetical protein
LRKPDSVKVSLKLPVVEIEGIWVPDKKQREAAWEMYIELVTRISVAELKPGEGLLREALSSLYSLFKTTREILRKYGPSVAKPKGKGHLSFGYLAVVILNVVLRPVLAKWHPLLLDYENSREQTVSPLKHEQCWEKAGELREVLNDTRKILIDYADLLAKVAGVPSLIIEHEGKRNVEID